MQILPELPQLMAFAVAALSLNIVPGADMTFVATAAARGGRRVGLLAALGIFAGCFAHIIAAVVGLSALVAASQTAVNLLKWVGAAYLLYIAYGLFRSPSAPMTGETGALPPMTGGKAFRTAALVNLLNPKVGLFFLAFLPQFIDPNATAPAAQIFALGLWFNVSGTIVNAIVALAAAHAAARVRGSRRFTRAVRWFAGTMMAGLAVQLALARTRPA